MENAWFFYLALAAITLHLIFILLALFAPRIHYQVKGLDQVEIGSAPFLHVLEALTDAKIHDARHLEVLTNGEQYYEAELEAIRQARHSIHLEAYIFYRGQVTRRFLEALAAKAREGVEVRVLVDAIGSFASTRRYFRPLLEAGGHVGFYHPLRLRLLPQINNRTHRELLIIDGCVGFIGGAGWGDHWLISTKREQRWRDTMVRVEGDAVVAMQAIFAENWVETDGELLADPCYFPPHDEEPGCPVLVVGSAPSLGRSSSARILFQTLIAAARKSIFITSPYFLPDGSAREELRRAADRGVQVVILTPGKNDHKLVQGSSRRMYGSLLEHGIRIFEYQPSMLHVKSMMVDELWSVVGSTNFDHRSFGLNDEVNMAVRDAALAHRLTEDFQRDLAESKEFTLEVWRRRPLWERAFEWVGWVLERQQ